MKRRLASRAWIGLPGRAWMFHAALALEIVLLFLCACATMAAPGVALLNDWLLTAMILGIAFVMLAARDRVRDWRRRNFFTGAE